MRNFLAWSLLTALALPARADIIDSGYLQVGGQGIFGGTVTVQGNALGVAGSVSATSATLSATGAQTYALTTSSGIHMVNGKLKLDSGAMIQWPDGSTSTTAASAGGGGNAVLSATQTFSGANTFQNIAALAYGSPAGPNPLNVPQAAVWATSVDGASQSSGCVVVVKSDGNGTEALIVFTSTTSIMTRANAKGVFGVLLETCAPGAACRVGTRGLYRVQSGASGIPNGYTESLSSTRCGTHPNGADDSNTVAYSLAPSDVPASTWHWVYLKN